MANRISYRILALLLLALLAAAPPATAGGIGGSVKLTASRFTILADGKQTTEITAYVRDNTGRPAANNVEVQFFATSGRLSQQRALTLSGGVARVTLTSAPISGMAKVTATVIGGGVDVLDILFTDDPEATFQGNNYVSAVGPAYLAYSATDRLIEAHGKNGTAKISYRNIEISADRMQLRCDDNIVRAHDNIVIKRGPYKVLASRLYYSLQSGQGYGIVEQEGRLRPVLITGERLRIEASPSPIPSSYLAMQTPQVKLVVVARGITYFPNDRLQFRGPRFYQDDQLILKLPYYELSLYSTELFSDQFLSVGTNGFGLELPFYYNLTPNSTGIVFLRHQQQIGRGYYSNTPGWSLDLVQSYSSQGNRRFEGTLGFIGLPRSDWGFRWNHNQEINDHTQGSMFLDFPSHRGVFSSTNLSQQYKAFRWGANVAVGQTFSGPRDFSWRNDLFVETQPRPFVGSTYYTLGSTYASGSVSSGQNSFSDSVQTVSMRAFSRPITLDRRTTMTNAFTVGHLWSRTGKSGPMAMATLAFDHTGRGGGGLNLTYDMVLQPQHFDYEGGRHRLSMTYTLASTKRFQTSLFASGFLDASDATLLADAIYRLDRNWRLMGLVTLQKFAGESFSDLQFTIGRRIGARELQLTYSTYNRRISVDFTATRF